MADTVAMTTESVPPPVDEAPADPAPEPAHEKRRLTAVLPSETAELDHAPDPAPIASAAERIERAAERISRVLDATGHAVHDAEYAKVHAYRVHVAEGLVDLHRELEDLRAVEAETGPALRAALEQYSRAEWAYVEPRSVRLIAAQARELASGMLNMLRANPGAVRQMLRRMEGWDAGHFHHFAPARQAEVDLYDARALVGTAVRAREAVARLGEIALQLARVRLQPPAHLDTTERGAIEVPHARPQQYAHSASARR